MMRSIRRFRRADGGLSAVEFALIAPVMVVLFFGIAEISSFVLAARKVSNIASSAADLVAQTTTINDAEVNDVMGALNAVLRPFNPADAQIRISSVVADSDGETTVDWSDARNTTAYSQGTPITIPNDIVPDNHGIIMAEVSFTYRTFFGMFLTDGITVRDTFYLKPRRSTTVQRL